MSLTSFNYRSIYVVLLSSGVACVEGPPPGRLPAPLPKPRLHSLRNTPPTSRKLLTEVRKTRIGASSRRECVCAGGVAGADSADYGGLQSAGGRGRGRRPARSPPGCGMAASLWMGDVSEGHACSERTRGSRVLEEGGAEG